MKKPSSDNSLIRHAIIEDVNGYSAEERLQKPMPYIHTDSPLVGGNTGI